MKEKTPVRIGQTWSYSKTQGRIRVFSITGIRHGYACTSDGKNVRLDRMKTRNHYRLLKDVKEEEEPCPDSSTAALPENSGNPTAAIVPSASPAPASS